MKAFVLTCLLSIAFFLRSHPQSSFEYLIEDPADNTIGTPLEDSFGNIVFPVFNNQYTELYKIDDQGFFIDSIRILNPINGSCELFTLLKIDDTKFMAFGGYNEETSSNFWITSFDFSLNKSIDIKYPIDGNIAINYIHAIFNNSGNIVLAAVYRGQGPYESDIFFLEITEDGTTVKESFLEAPNNDLKLIFDLIQLNPLVYRIVKAGVFQKSTITYIDLDTNFNILSENQLPYNLEQISYTSIKQNSSSLFYSGIKTVSGKGDNDLGLIKTDYNNILIDSAHFGKVDSVDYPGIYDNLDFVSENAIYYGGTSNLNEGTLFPSMPSWFMLNKLDTNLNLYWQKYYGGDAYYELWSILATQDGGCVMAGTRYDHQTQNEERDVYILKVNGDGLITWVHNVPEVTKQVLVYPNPGSGVINIKAIERDITFELYDEQGNKLVNKVLPNGNTKVNSGSLSIGVYVYRVLDVEGQVIETGKWIKN